MIKKLLKHWPIFLLVILTFILRIIKLEELFYFTYDESIPAFVARRLILWQHIPLIGGVTPFNFHLGPYFYWFYTLILYPAKLNPIGWGYASAAIATITTYLIYLVGKNFASRKVGFTAATFWTFSYLANVYDRHLWALYWGPLVSTLTIFSLYKITKGHHKFVYLLGATIGLSIHADPSNLVLLFLSLVVWYIYGLPIKKSTLIAVFFVVFSFLPLLIFDLRHNFANSKPVVDFWKQGANVPGFNLERFGENSLFFPQAFSRLIYTFGDNEIAKQYSYCQTYVTEKLKAVPLVIVSLFLFAIVSFIIWSIRINKREPGWHFVGLLIVLYFIGIQLYGTIFRADIFEHYITGTFVIFLLIFAKIVSLLPKKLWLIALAFFVLANLYKLSKATNSLGLSYKREAIQFTMQQVQDKPFSLDSLSTCWKLNGYRYLFTVFGREPVKSYVDPNFAYLYGTTLVAEKHPPTVVAFIVHDFKPENNDFYQRYALLKSHEVKAALFGNIEVVIMDNSTSWFDKPQTLKNPNVSAGQD